MLRHFAIILVVAAGASVASAQATAPSALVSRLAPAVPLGSIAATTGHRHQSTVDRGERQAAPLARHPPAWWTPAASAVVPGAGQLLLRQQRGAAYAALEGYLLLQYVAARRDGVKARDRYREIARTEARARFGGPLPDGGWSYYERLEKVDPATQQPLYIESGAYDRIPGGELDPETAAGTYNGAVWAQARALYWRDAAIPPPIGSPEYSRAIAFYVDRADRPEFQWSWAERQIVGLGPYRQAIARSNASFRSATQYLSAVVANHALSMVDAFVTVQVGRARDGGFNVEARVPWAPLGRANRR